MKKVYLFLIITVLTLLSSGAVVRAQTTTGFPKGSNFLDLSNLKMLDNHPEFARTLNRIQVRANQQYTIVLDYGFLGQHTADLGELYITIQEYPTLNTYNLPILGSHATETAYVEFTPQDGFIHILELPMDPQNYNAIMYEGSFLDFAGYEPFLNQNEIMSYYGVLPMDYDQLMAIEQIKTFINVTDPYGEPLIMNVDSDTYSLSSRLPGSYQIVFSATFNNITKSYYLDINVFDQAPPVIINPGVISVPLSDKLNIEQIKQLILVTDNVDTISSSELVITNDTYSIADIVGSYSITVQATDSSQNQTTQVISINLVDETGPEIIGPSAIYLYTTDIALTNNQILNHFTITDNVDGVNVGVNFSLDNYTQNQMPGVYQMTIIATDVELNSTTFSLNIHVIENRGPVFSNEAIILSVDAANAMTNQELIDWFIAHTLSQGYSVTDVTILFSEYENNEGKEGSYFVYLSYSLDGEMETSRITVNVEKEDVLIKYLPFLATGIPILIGGVVIYKIRKRK